MLIKFITKSVNIRFERAFFLIFLFLTYYKQLTIFLFYISYKQKTN